MRMISSNVRTQKGTSLHSGGQGKKRGCHPRGHHVPRGNFLLCGLPFGRTIEENSSRQTATHLHGLQLEDHAAICTENNHIQPTLGNPLTPRSHRRRSLYQLKGLPLSFNALPQEISKATTNGRNLPIFFLFFFWLEKVSYKFSFQFSLYFD